MICWELKKLSALALLAATAGCSSLSPEWCEPVEDTAKPLARLLARSEQLVTQAADAQQQELAAAQAAYEAEAGELNRLRLSLALSQLPAVRDDGRLVALIAGWPEASNPSMARQLALILQRQAAERQRAGKDIRDEQRRTDGVRDDLRRNEGLLREEKKRSDELQQKLDALRVIDRETRRTERR